MTTRNLSNMTGHCVILAASSTTTTLTAWVTNILNWPWVCTHACNHTHTHTDRFIYFCRINKCTSSQTYMTMFTHTHPSTNHHHTTRHLLFLLKHKLIHRHTRPPTSIGSSVMKNLERGARDESIMNDWIHHRNRCVKQMCGPAWHTQQVGSMFTNSQRQTLETTWICKHD